MAGSREIQRRIKSVSNIGKVTRAMEAVSASKMRRAQEATLRSRAYALKAAQVLAHLRAQSKDGAVLHPLLTAQPQGVAQGKPAVILITPDRGLTGGLVLSIIRFAVRQAEEALGKDLAWISLGKKGRDFLARAGADLRASFIGIPDTPTVLDVSPAARIVLDGFLGADYASVHMVYADFISPVKQLPVLQQMLPIQIPDDLPPSQAIFDFEPSPEAVLDEILPRLLEMRMYQAVLEGQASEHSARMLAMGNATSAAKDLVGELTLARNKARQSDITSEILDIAGGAEALRQAMKAK